MGLARRGGAPLPTLMGMTFPVAGRTGAPRWAPRAGAADGGEGLLRATRRVRQ